MWQISPWDARLGAFQRRYQALVAYSGHLSLRAPRAAGQQALVALREVEEPGTNRWRYALVCFQSQAQRGYPPVLEGPRLEADPDEFFPTIPSGGVAALRTMAASVGDGPIEGARALYRQRPAHGQGRRVTLTFQPGERLLVSGVAELMRANPQMIEETPLGEEARFFSSTPSFLTGLISHVNLCRHLAVHPEIPEWAAEYLLRVPDLETIEALAQNPRLPEKLRARADVLFEHSAFAGVAREQVP